ncbi:MAG: succinylglutamate desuccinylase/aspartoacylase family protein [Bacteroidales bacterium]|jgi:hypothetical protein|nr:succinylglutamate desuccinylase/aspartoacylase family protein [Bacteroidales bacterium]
MKKIIIIVLFVLIAKGSFAQSNEGKVMGNTLNEMFSWDKYPTYDTYLTLMGWFVETYPDICRLDTIGMTNEGRLLLTLIISDSVNNESDEPKFFYSSSMHGDELTGAVMLLRLAHYLLSNYATDTRVAAIVNNIVLYVCPLANPDGTYRSGNNDVSGAIRYNSNLVDLNRNFPSPRSGQHPDGNSWQNETLAFMNYALANQFDLNVNLHGGAEVCNYPFDDRLPSNQKKHADNQWFIETCSRFMDTIRLHSSSSYFTDVANNGYILGYDWYAISGSRQDYHTYFLHQREITLEVSTTKTPNSSLLPTYWDYLQSGLLCFIEECFNGVDGVVKDSVTGERLGEVFIYIQGYDRDSSQIYSKSNGYFFRPLHQGSYALTFVKAGYLPKTISFDLNQSNKISQEVLLVKEAGLYDVEMTETAIYPNPCIKEVNVKMQSNGFFVLYDIAGVERMTGTLCQGENLIDVSDIEADGCYFITLMNEKKERIITKPLIIKIK